MTLEGVTAVTPTGETLRVREVWEDNLEKEMEIIRGVIDDYPYVAMDTEFPGVVARPVGDFKNSREYHYQTLRVNVDMLKLIQLGLTLSNEEGKLPKHNDELCVWQFNFREFDVENDIHSGAQRRALAVPSPLLLPADPPIPFFLRHVRGIHRAAQVQRHRLREVGEAGHRRPPFRGAPHVLGGGFERKGAPT